MSRFRYNDICLIGGLGPGTWAATILQWNLDVVWLEIEKDCSTIDKENASKKVTYNG
jgi:hypothetical protein